MTAEQIVEVCLKKPGSYIDRPFGPEVTVIKVRAERYPASRIFAQLFHLKGVPCATFNCSPLAGEFYRSVYPGAVTRGYHCPPVQQPYFNTVKLSGDVPDEEILRMIDHSYAVVVAKLPKYVRRELGA